jgi:hypothetical protein
MHVGSLVVMPSLESKLKRQLITNTKCPFRNFNAIYIYRERERLIFLIKNININIFSQLRRQLGGEGGACKMASRLRMVTSDNLASINNKYSY